MIIFWVLLASVAAGVYFYFFNKKTQENETSTSNWDNNVAPMPSFEHPKMPPLEPTPEPQVAAPPEPTPTTPAAEPTPTADAPKESKTELQTAAEGTVAMPTTATSPSEVNMKTARPLPYDTQTPENVKKSRRSKKRSTSESGSKKRRHSSKKRRKSSKSPAKPDESNSSSAQQSPSVPVPALPSGESSPAVEQPPPVEKPEEQQQPPVETPAVEQPPVVPPAAEQPPPVEKPAAEQSPSAEQTPGDTSVPPPPVDQMTPSDLNTAIAPLPPQGAEIASEQSISSVATAQEGGVQTAVLPPMSESVGTAKEESVTANDVTPVPASEVPPVPIPEGANADQSAEKLKTGIEPLPPKGAELTTQQSQAVQPSVKPSDSDAHVTSVTTDSSMPSQPDVIVNTADGTAIATPSKKKRRRRSKQAEGSGKRRSSKRRRSAEQKEAPRAAKVANGK